MKVENGGLGAPAVPALAEQDGRSALAGLRRVAGNIISLVGSDVVNRASTFVLYALVGRQLGAREFGQLSLALTLFYVAQVFAVAGLKTLITREVARDRSRTDLYLVNGSAIVAGSSLLSIAVLWAFVGLMGYSADTGSVILLLSLALFPYSQAAICEAIFQAWERMRYIAYANVSVNLAKVVLAYLALARGYGLHHLVLLLLVSQTVVAVVEWLIVLRSISRPRTGVDVRVLLGMARRTTAFLGIDGILAISASTSVLILSKLANETEVGLYNAASQLMVPMTLLYQGVALSVFPIMCRRFDSSVGSLKQIARVMIELQLAVALPAILGLLFLAGPALALLYGGRDFGAAAGPLRILSWNLALIALTSVMGQVLLASLRERVNLRIVAVDALVSLLLGAILIGPFGTTGAAVAALLTRVVDFSQHYLAVNRVIPGIGLVGLAWKPVVAVAITALYLTTVRDNGLLLDVASASLLYAATLLALMIWSAGGLRQLRARLLNLRLR